MPLSKREAGWIFMVYKTVFCVRIMPGVIIMIKSA